MYSQEDIYVCVCVYLMTVNVAKNFFAMFSREHSIEMASDIYTHDLQQQQQQQRMNIYIYMIALI